MCLLSNDRRAVKQRGDAGRHFGVGGRAAPEAGQHEASDGGAQGHDPRRDQRAQAAQPELRPDRRQLSILDLRHGARRHTQRQLLRLLQSLQRGA